MRRFALLGLGLVLLGAAWQQVSLPAPLANHFDKLTTTPNITIVYKVGPVGDVPADYELDLAKPNMFKLTWDGGFVVSDGTNIYTYKQDDNTYTVDPVTDDSIAAFAARPEVYGWAGFLNKKVTDDITGAKAGEARTIQKVKVNEMNVSLKDDNSLTLFLDPTLGFARDFSYKKGDKTYLAVASKVDVETKLTSDQFAFSAPSGAKKVEAPKATDATYANVQQIMTSSCMPCHSASNKSGGFDLTNYSGIKAAVTPGDGANSKLVTSLRASGGGRMPKGRKPLPEDKITLITKWIDAGAKQ